MNGYHVLANAVIIQAVEDYKEALQTLRNNPGNREALKAVKEIDEFFHSEWYQMLTDVAGEFLLDRLRKEEVK